MLYYRPVFPKHLFIINVPTAFDSYSYALSCAHLLQFNQTVRDCVSLLTHCQAVNNFKQIVICELLQLELSILLTS